MLDTRYWILDARIRGSEGPVGIRPGLFYIPLRRTLGTGRGGFVLRSLAPWAQAAGIFTTHLFNLDILFPGK